MALAALKLNCFIEAPGDRHAELIQWLVFVHVYLELFGWYCHSGELLVQFLDGQDQVRHPWPAFTDGVDSRGSTGGGLLGKSGLRALSGSGERRGLGPPGHGNTALERHELLQLLSCEAALGEQIRGVLLPRDFAQLEPLGSHGMLHP